jgi:putative membrane protein
MRFGIYVKAAGTAAVRIATVSVALSVNRISRGLGINRSIRAYVEHFLAHRKRFHHSQAALRGCINKEGMMTDGISVKTANELAGDRTDLAIERTRMAANRTSMAWVRTGTSLISFGFTIYKVMQAALGDTNVGLLKLAGARRLGLLLIALGTASIICGTFEYFKTVNHLNRMSGAKLKRFDMSLVVGGVVGVLGFVLFITILTHSEVF